MGASVLVYRGDGDDEQISKNAMVVGLSIRSLRRARWLDLLGKTILNGSEPALGAGEVDTLDQVAIKNGALMSEIADGLQVTRSTATRAISRLVDRGLVDRHRDPEFGRHVRVELTAKGARVQSELLQKRLAFTERVFSQLDDDDQEAIARILPHLTKLILSELESFSSDP